MENKNVFVTGGAGYIGSHTCKLLNARGYKPICYDNLSTGHAEFVKWGPLFKGDLDDTERLSKLLQEYKPLAVIHFAGSAYVGESVVNPLKYYNNNVSGTISLLSAMKSAKISRIVFSSSCATYGIPSILPITESTIQNPINPYGRTKLIVENILDDLKKAGQIEYVALRYFNAAGADKSGDIGERHDPETHIIPLAIKSAFTNEVLRINGADFSTPDGSPVRDYVHVEDLAEAHALALEYLLQKSTSTCLNLGTGTGVSVFEICNKLSEIGAKSKYVISDRREGDPAALVADSSQANKVLGWNPKNSSIDNILNSALNWYFVENKNAR